MRMQDALKPIPKAARMTGRPVCPHCGTRMVAPLVAAYAGSGNVRHLWSCDGCGHNVETAVEMPATGNVR